MSKFILRHHVSLPTKLFDIDAIPILYSAILLFLIFSRAVECKIFVGIHNLYEITTNHTYASNVFYEHPYYNPKEIKNDVALVELPDEIEFTGKFACIILLEHLQNISIVDCILIMA